MPVPLRRAAAARVRHGAARGGPALAGVSGERLLGVREGGLTEGARREARGWRRAAGGGRRAAGGWRRAAGGGRRAAGGGRRCESA
ncbi:hypothetical protein BOC39_14580 [Burkholderia pseudomallei]|nr:hypothetical protein BOC39_14580 [Burkholderia pseudomallei]